MQFNGRTLKIEQTGTMAGFASQGLAENLAIFLAKSGYDAIFDPGSGETGAED